MVIFGISYDDGYYFILRYFVKILLLLFFIKIYFKFYFKLFKQLIIVYNDLILENAIKLRFLNKFQLLFDPTIMY